MIKIALSGCIVLWIFTIETVCGQMNFVSSSITLEGQSSGGTLTLSRASVGNLPYILITNNAGESAESVLRRLAEQFEFPACPSCKEYFGGPVMSLSSNHMVLTGGPFQRNYSSWVFGGTESGFKIPAPLLSLTASYSSNNITLNWENSPGGYDRIGVIILLFPWYSLDGAATNFIHNPTMGGWASGDVTYQLVGYKNGTPSNLVGLRLKNYLRQESLMNVPFSWGVAPGFKTWTLNAAPDSLRFEQGNLPGVAPGVELRSFVANGFYQVLRGNGSFTGGVSRRFLGLNSGHAYRVSARVNTFDAKEGDWVFSVHAAYGSAQGEAISPDQMAGKATLPNKMKGADAGLVASYNSSTNTAGNWITCSSESTKSDVTLPDNVNSLTIWFRLQGSHATNVVVGFDSVTLEDLGILRVTTDDKAGQYAVVDSDKEVVTLKDAAGNSLWSTNVINIFRIPFSGEKKIYEMKLFNDQLLIKAGLNAYILIDKHTGQVLDYGSG